MSLYGMVCGSMSLSQYVHGNRNDPGKSELYPETEAVRPGLKEERRELRTERTGLVRH